jgi:hypothetical protein
MGIVLVLAFAALLALTVTAVVRWRQAVRTAALWRRVAVDVLRPDSSPAELAAAHIVAGVLLRRGA